MIPPAAPDAPPAESELGWHDGLLLGIASIDDEHRGFVERLVALRAAGEADRLARLDDFAAHASAHFDVENAVMAETGFPPRECHVDEHAAVMASVREVRALAAAGRLDAIPPLAQALADWFPRHVHHLDSALVHWLGKQRWNAKPVVVRRNAARAG